MAKGKGFKHLLENLTEKGEEYITKAGHDLAKESRDLQSKEQQAYKQVSKKLESFRNFGYSRGDLKKIINDYIPKAEKNYMESLRKEVENRVYWGRDAAHRYKEHMKKLIDISEQYNQAVSTPDPMKSKGIDNRIQKLQKERDEERMKISEYGSYLENVFNELDNLRSTALEKMKHYLSREDEGKKNLSHTFVAVIVGVFGVSVLYALANIRPENISTGAFFAAGGSAVLGIATMIAFVLFFLFFFTHKKLE